VLDATISSRAFSSGFEIKTPGEVFSAEKVPLSLSGEIRILNGAGYQIARIEFESFLSSVYNIIMTGGGFYHFGRDRSSGRAWSCKGEGRRFCISEETSRKFLMCEQAQQIAEVSKSRFFRDYQVRVFNDADWKLVMCAFVALVELEHQTTPTPD
jgi:hypothetical protein